MMHQSVSFSFRNRLSCLVNILKKLQHFSVSTSGGYLSCIEPSRKADLWCLQKSPYTRKYEAALSWIRPVFIFNNITLQSFRQSFRSLTWRWWGLTNMQSRCPIQLVPPPPAFAVGKNLLPVLALTWAGNFNLARKPSPHYPPAFC